VKMSFLMLIEEGSSRSEILFYDRPRDKELMGRCIPCQKWGTDSAQPVLGRGKLRNGNDDSSHHRDIQFNISGALKIFLT
jgi:hypothetical protein